MYRLRSMRSSPREWPKTPTTVPRPPRAGRGGTRRGGRFRGQHHRGVAAHHGPRIRLSSKTARLLAVAVAVTVLAAVAVIIGVRLGIRWRGQLPAPIAPAYSSQTPLPFTGVNLPTGVAVDTAGNVYVADLGNDRVARLEAGASAATPLPFPGLKNPQGVAVDTAGNVYVTDTSNNRVMRLAAGASAPTPLPFPGLKNPSGCGGRHCGQRIRRRPG